MDGNANILNKESQTADKEWSSMLWIGWGLTTPYHKTSMLQNVTHGLGLDFNKQNLVSHFKGRTDLRFDNRVLRRIFGLKMDEVTEG
jgi:hypothetical protein